MYHLKNTTVSVSSVSQAQAEVVVVAVVVVLTSRAQRDSRWRPAASKCARSWRRATRSWGSARKIRSNTSCRAEAWKTCVPRTKSISVKLRSQASGGVVRRRVRWGRDSKEDAEGELSRWSEMKWLDDEYNHLPKPPWITSFMFVDLKEKTSWGKHLYIVEFNNWALNLPQSIYRNDPVNWSSLFYACWQINVFDYWDISIHIINWWQNTDVNTTMFCVFICSFYFVSSIQLLTKAIVSKKKKKLKKEG